LLLAYAAFQDRLALALGLPLEEGGPLPPIEVRFVKPKPDEKAPLVVPPRQAPQEHAAGSAPGKVSDPEWLALDFKSLQKELAVQRDRKPRIAVPAWEEVKKQLPAEYVANRPPVRIRWSLVCMGYQPELALGWSACLRAFQEESKQDRVFEESLFW